LGRGGGGVGAMRCGVSFIFWHPCGGCATAPHDPDRYWKQLVMWLLEKIRLVAGIYSAPMHDPVRRRNSRPCDGLRVNQC